VPLDRGPHERTTVRTAGGQTFDIDHGSVVVAAITSCTNTSNPSVMVAAGLLARKARQRGLTVPPWVKTSLAPGSKVVTDYYERSGLDEDLGALGFYLVGYGCTTCIGNSGPLDPAVSEAIDQVGLATAAVLSGNRNFEGRIHPDVRMNFLASPPLVVAFALAGTVEIDLTTDPLGEDPEGRPVHLRDIWPSSAEVQEVIASSLEAGMFSRRYAPDQQLGDPEWRDLEAPTGDRMVWPEGSTYIRRPTFLTGIPRDPAPPRDITGARVLAFLGDSVTTDHISPAGVIAPGSPAGRWLVEHGVEPRDFNSYGSRRGNHEVMVRGTFANPRIRNRMAPGTEGGVTTHLPTGEVLSIYDAAQRYATDGTPLIVLAGKEYGSGSSRDWAAKGSLLLGIRAVLAQSFERIHRSNLVDMGILPLQFLDGESADSLGLTGQEHYDVLGVAELTGWPVPEQLTVRADDREFRVRLRIDAEAEAEYWRHGGILDSVIRDFAARAR
jgi:aconitate hydratase